MVISRVRMGQEERREQLLRVGVELLGRRRHGAVSIDEIAEDAGVAKGLLYHYFASKDEFIAAVLERGERELADCLAPDLSLPAGERLNASLNAFFDHLEERPYGYASMAQGGGENPVLRAALAAGRTEQLERLVEAVTESEETPVSIKRSPALETVLQGWLFFCEGVMPRWLEQDDLEREQIRTLLRVALDGALRAAAPVGKS